MSAYENSSMDDSMYNESQTIPTGKTTSKKHTEFVAEPLVEKEVTSIPGIGHVTGKKLEEAGIDKAYMVLGQFLLLRKDEELFIEWLKTFGAQNRHAKCCYEAFKEWCKSFI
ncbi:hypothetical protein GJ496_005445 [Pomphorhynchus laevis]|nr:hypothetical protein GJ496_005445 [Pomphorhynchus laevis]